MPVFSLQIDSRQKNKKFNGINPYGPRFQVSGSAPALLTPDIQCHKLKPLESLPGVANPLRAERLIEL